MSILGSVLSSGFEAVQDLVAPDSAGSQQRALEKEQTVYNRNLLKDKEAERRATQSEQYVTQRELADPSYDKSKDKEYQKRWGSTEPKKEVSWIGSTLSGIAGGVVGTALGGPLGGVVGATLGKEAYAKVEGEDSPTMHLADKLKGLAQGILPDTKQQGAQASLAQKASVEDVNDKKMINMPSSPDKADTTPDGYSDRVAKGLPTGIGQIAYGTPGSYEVQQAAGIAQKRQQALDKIDYKLSVLEKHPTPANEKEANDLSRQRETLFKDSEQAANRAQTMRDRHLDAVGAGISALLDTPSQSNLDQLRKIERQDHEEVVRRMPGANNKTPEEISKMVDSYEESLPESSRLPKVMDEDGLFKLDVMQRQLTTTRYSQQQEKQRAKEANDSIRNAETARRNSEKAQIDKDKLAARAREESGRNARSQVAHSAKADKTNQYFVHQEKELGNMKHSVDQANANITKYKQQLEYAKINFLPKEDISRIEKDIESETSRKSGLETTYDTARKAHQLAVDSYYTNKPKPSETAKPKFDFSQFHHE